jgi:hypothetical protein
MAVIDTTPAGKAADQVNAACKMFAMNVKRGIFQNKLATPQEICDKLDDAAGLFTALEALTGDDQAPAGVTVTKNTDKSVTITQA